MSEGVDVHTHALHSKIAEKVLRQLAEHYRITPKFPGTWDDLQQRMKDCGIGKCFVHTAATRPDQVIAANNWAISLKQYSMAIPFGTMHIDYTDMEGELARLWDSGIRGIKLHPDFQKFWLDDPKLLPLFGAMEGRFTLMVHVGDRVPPKDNPSCPYKVAAIKRKFPKLQMIAAHFGGFHHWEHVIEAYRGLGIYMDTSSSLFMIPQEQLEQIFNFFPRHLFLFGSDYPIWDPAAERDELQRRLRLSDSELEEIMTAGSRLELNT